MKMAAPSIIITYVFFHLKLFAELSLILHTAILLSVFNDYILAVKKHVTCLQFVLSICGNRSETASCSLIRVNTQSSPEHRIDVVSGAIIADCVNNESFTTFLITHCFAGMSGSRGAVRLCTNTRLPEKSINMIYVTDRCDHFD